MPYIGRDLNRGNYLKLDDISSSFNGSTQTFNLTVGGSAFTPGSAFSILVSVGGVIQEPESAYQVNNSEITFANAPTAQDSFFCIALAVPIGIGVPGNGTVNGTQVAKPFNYDGYFYLDDANNRVGIGSLSPTVELDVSGTIKASSFSGPIGNPSGISTFYDLRVINNLTVEGTTTTLDTNLIDVDRVDIGANSNTDTAIVGIQSGTADIVNLFDGTKEVLTVQDGGRVGIGTTDPNATGLTVYRDDAGLGNIVNIEQDGSGDAVLGFAIKGTAAWQFGIDNDDSDKFKISYDGSGLNSNTSVTLDRSGKIGIGQDAPSSMLTIKDLTGGQSLLIEGSGGNDVVVLGSVNGATNRGELIIKEGTTGQEKVKFSSKASTPNFIISNDFGVGTITPSARFEVSAGANVVSTFLKTTSDKSYIEFEHNAGATYNARFGSATLGAGNVGFIFETGLASSTINAMAIDRYGRVGIGSMLPTSILDIAVADPILTLRDLSATVTNANATLRLAESDANGVTENYWDVVADNTVSNFGFSIKQNLGGTTTPRIVIHPGTGSVGIGTDNPRATYLHVGDNNGKLAGSVFTSSPLSVFASDNLGGTAGNNHKIAIFGGKTTGNTSGLSIYHYRRENGTDWTTDGFSFRQEVDNTANIYNYMTFAGGNVGINNTTPDQKLQVTGSIKLSGQVMQNVPTDFWSQGNTFIELNGVGNLTHMGGYETNITSNGYRDTSGNWVSLQSGPSGSEYSGAAQIGLKPQGSIVFRTDASKANGTAHNPTPRLIIDDEGVRPQGGTLNLRNSSSTGNVLINVLGVSGDSRIDLENTGDGNYSGIDFIRERQSGTGIPGGSIFMKSDTSAASKAYLYIQAQSASAQSPVTTALSDNNGVRLILKGTDGILSVEAGASEKLRVQPDGTTVIGGHTIGTYDESKLSVFDSTSNLGIIQIHHSAAGGGAESAGDLSGIVFGHGGSNSSTRPKVAIASRATGAYGRGDLCFYVDGASDNNRVSTADERVRISGNGDMRVGGGGAPATFGSGTTVHETYNANTYVANLVTSGTHILQMIASQTHGTTSIGTRSSHNLNLCVADASKMMIDTNGNVTQYGTTFSQTSASNTVIQTTRTTEGVVTSLQSISNPLGRVGTTSNHNLEVVTNNTAALTVNTSLELLAATQSFVSKFHYNPGIQATGGWSTNWNTIIPGGTLGYNDTYVITAYWQHNHNGGNANSPYLMQASFLYSSVSVNNTTGGNVEFVPFQTAHVGGGIHRLEFRMIPVGGHTTAGVQVKNPAGFHASYGGITVKAFRLGDF